MKNYYDCTFIVNPALDDAQTESVVKAVEETIQKHSGVIAVTDRIGRRRLAYPIAKKHNGYYVSIEFEAEGSAIERVERALTLDENVIRYLTLKLDKRQLEAKKLRAAAVLELAAEPLEDAKPAVSSEDDNI